MNQYYSGRNKSIGCNYMTSYSISATNTVFIEYHIHICPFLIFDLQENITCGCALKQREIPLLPVTPVRTCWITSRTTLINSFVVLRLLTISLCSVQAEKMASKLELLTANTHMTFTRYVAHLQIPVSAAGGCCHKPCLSGMGLVQYLNNNGTTAT